MANRTQQILYNIIFEEIIHTYIFEEKKLDNSNFNDKPFEIHFNSIINSDYFEDFLPSIPNSINKDVGKIIIIKTSKKDYVAVFNKNDFPFIEDYEFDKKDGTLIIRTTLSKLKDFVSSKYQTLQEHLNYESTTNSNPIDVTDNTKYVLENIERVCNENIKTIYDTIIRILYYNFIYYKKTTIIVPTIYCGNYDEAIKRTTNIPISSLVANYNLEDFFLIGIPKENDIMYLPVLRASFESMMKSLNLKWSFTDDTKSMIINVNMIDFRNRFVNSLTGTGTHK